MESEESDDSNFIATLIIFALIVMLLIIFHDYLFVFFEWLFKLPESLKSFLP